MRAGQRVGLAAARASLAHARAADLRSEESVRELITITSQTLGGLDVLVNNAGDQHVVPLDQTTLADWRRVLDVGLDACFLLCREAAPLLRAAAPGSKVLNVASIASTIAIPQAPAYVAAKSALAGLTRSLALDWASDGIQVNALAPGFVRTAMTRAAGGDERNADWVVRRTPAGRWAEPEELVGAAVFLASSASDFVTGEVLHVDGGWTVQ